MTIAPRYCFYHPGQLRSYLNYDPKSQEVKWRLGEYRLFCKSLPFIITIKAHYQFLGSSYQSYRDLQNSSKSKRHGLAEPPTTLLYPGHNIVEHHLCCQDDDHDMTVIRHKILPDYIITIHNDWTYLDDVSYDISFSSRINKVHLNRVAVRCTRYFP